MVGCFVNLQRFSKTRTDIGFVTSSRFPLTLTPQGVRVFVPPYQISISLCTFVYITRVRSLARYHGRRKEHNSVLYLVVLGLSTEIHTILIQLVIRDSYPWTEGSLTLLISGFIIFIFFSCFMEAFLALSCSQS